MPDWTRRVSGRYLCADADMCGPLCRPWANKKPAEEKILAGHTCHRPFSYLFYVASKPAGSNDHEIDVVIRSDRLPVKAPAGVDRRRDAARDQGHLARSHDRRV